MSVCVTEAAALQHPRHEHRRPVHHRDKRTGYEADGGERVVFDIGLRVEPAKTKFNSAGRFEQ